MRSKRRFDSLSHLDPDATFAESALVVPSDERRGMKLSLHSEFEMPIEHMHTSDRKPQRSNVHAPVLTYPL